MKLPCILLTLPLLSILPLPVQAGSSQETQTIISYDPPPAAPRSCFEKGRWSAEVLFEACDSFSYGGHRPTINYAQGGLRIGRMLSDVRGDGFWRGNVELLIEGLYAGVTHGSGNWISGANFILRRNFVSANEKRTWYAQIGWGIVWNDIYEDLGQTLVGRSREFSLLAGLGMRYQLKNDWFVLIEGTYRHISNADTAPRNTGLDSFGVGIGVGRSF